MSFSDIIIVNWNAGSYLKKCVTSVLQSKGQALVNVIYVIDNASTDDSIESVQNFEKIKIIQNTVNKGFGMACNQGIALSSAPYVVMVNPDVVLFETTLEDSIAYMEANKQIDILGAMQLDETGKIMASCARFPTPLRFFNDAIGLSKLFPRIFKPATLMTDWDHTESKEVDQVIGSYMFIRRSVFDRIGIFDPLFFVYYEELDLSKRLKNAGGISYYNHHIQLLHYGEGTTKNVKAYRLYLNLKSKMLYAKKHFTKSGFLFTYLATLLIEPITRIFFLLLQGRFKDIAHAISGYTLLWREWKFIFKPSTS